jgi:hypothetical protein
LLELFICSNSIIKKLIQLSKGFSDSWEAKLSKKSEAFNKLLRKERAVAVEIEKQLQFDLL